MSGLRLLREGDQQRFSELLAVDPVANCFVASRFEVAGLESWRLGGEVLGHFQGRELTSALFVGANLIPIGPTESAGSTYADQLRSQGRRSSSIVGPATQVLALWSALEPAWGPAREIRAVQPLMLIDGPPKLTGDPMVRNATYEDLELLLPACVAMFTEEVGLAPFPIGAGAAYRSRVADLVRSGRSYVRLVDGRVEFKAEVGAVSRSVCQVQGVWVAPECRGQGLSVIGMAAVVAAARARHSPTVSLYVNGYNKPARASYEHVGFREVGSFATVLF